jgi:hypothetical protein
MDFIIANSTFDPKTECWLWNRSQDGRGYAVHGGAGIRIARFAWELEHKREMPSTHEACHTCDTPSCVNPKHVFEGTHAINMLDKQQKRRHRVRCSMRHTAPNYQLEVARAPK